LKISTRSALQAMVDIISSNLIQLAEINERLENYKITSPNVLSLEEDTDLVSLLETAIDLRLKIVEMLSDGRKYILDAITNNSNRDLLSKLKTLAEFYIYAGSRIDKRIVKKYRGIIVLNGLESSIEELYSSFSLLLSDMGVRIIE